MNKSELINEALVAALRERRKLEGTPYSPFCIFDFVERRGVEIKFVELSTMEGIYSKEPGPLILLSSLRPHGRQYFNCAHEYGHHVFEHGMVIDELVEFQKTGKFDPKEFLVDTFAGFLLMPKTTIQRALNTRSIRLEDASALDFYRIASNLGVGYQTLLFHLNRSLQMISRATYEKFTKIGVSRIKKDLLSLEFPGEVIFVDENWDGRPIDLQVDDLLVVEGVHKIEGGLIERIAFINDRFIYKGICTGVGKVSIGDGDHHFLRVSKSKYSGFNMYKHLTG